MLVGIFLISINNDCKPISILFFWIYISWSYFPL